MNKATCLFTLVLTFHFVASMSEDIDSVVKIIIIQFFNDNEKSGRRINTDLYGSFYSDEDFLPANEFNINNEETIKGHDSDSLPYQHDLVSRPQPHIKTQIRDPYYSTVNIYENNRNVKREFSGRASKEDYYERSLAGNERSSPRPAKSNLKSILYVSDKALLQENQIKENKDYLIENDDLYEGLSDYFSDKDDLKYPGRNIAPKSLSSKSDTLQNDLDDYLYENYPGDKRTNEAFTLAKPTINYLHAYGDGLRDAEEIPKTTSTQSLWFEYNEPRNPVLPPEAKFCNPHSNCKIPFDEAGNT